MIPCRHLFHEENDEMLAMFPHQSEDYERCESMELDNKIRVLIKKNVASDSQGVNPEAMQSHRESCSSETHGKTASMSSESTAGKNTAETYAEPTESSLSRKNFTNPLERKIRCLEKQRKELLEVNQQWDQQFRSMKELYKTKVSELKTKLAVAEGILRNLEKERRPGQSPGDLRNEKEKESLNEELQELKKENKLLKEKNAFTNTKKEYYECEIKRLNKALQDVLKIESSFSVDYAGKCKGECSHEEMRTEMEVLRHQVQIYEEDFKKERLDRERLSQEKEQLQKMNQLSQSQLNRLNSQIQACQMEKEKLGMQLKQMYFSTCNGGLPFHLRDPWGPVDPGLTQHPWPQPASPQKRNPTSEHQQRSK